MPHYVSLIRYTHQGMSKIKDSPSRLDAAKKAAEKEGGKIQAWYLTMGHYDAVLISDFPSDEACDACEPVRSHKISPPARMGCSGDCSHRLNPLN